MWLCRQWRKFGNSASMQTITIDCTSFCAHTVQPITGYGYTDHVQLYIL